MTSTRETLQSVVARLAEVIDQLPADPPEVPDIIEQRPTNDKHLRGEFWKDKDGDIYRFSDGQWEVWSPRMREWVGAIDWLNSNWAPFTRVTDPSAPRTWDTLCDVPEDVERVTGYYLWASRELARSPLSESGWFELVLDGPFRWWTELPETETRNITNIKEDQS